MKHYDNPSCFTTPHNCHSLHSPPESSKCLIPSTTFLTIMLSVSSFKHHSLHSQPSCSQKLSIRLSLSTTLSFAPEISASEDNSFASGKGICILSRNFTSPIVSKPCLNRRHAEFIKACTCGVKPTDRK